MKRNCEGVWFLSLLLNNEKNKIINDNDGDLDFDFPLNWDALFDVGFCFSRFLYWLIKLDCQNVQLVWDIFEVRWIACCDGKE
jgi:hypothetical protein